MRNMFRTNVGYSYRVCWSSEDGQYVGLCDRFPSLSWLDDSTEAAMDGIQKVVTEVLEDLSNGGEARSRGADRSGR